MRGGGLLAAALAALWGLTYLVTQVIVQPPLAAGRMVLAGLVLSTVLTLGYPSVLRGPRMYRRRWPPSRARRVGQVGQTSGAARRAEPAPISIMGSSMPLRSGLTAEAANRTVTLLRPMLGADAVAITDRQQVLAFVGPGRDHHHPGKATITAATRKVLEGARTKVLHSAGALGCPEPSCPLSSAVIAPLHVGDSVVGALKVYRVDETAPSRDLVQGMAGILSLHLELADMDRERRLSASARLDALRAQINPHFLFNTLNTIASRARTHPEEARQLLLRLSDFFRYSTRQQGQFADFGQEYFFVRTYLALEQARFGERLAVRYDVDPQVLGVQIPVLVVQPLVENAVKHGLAQSVKGGTVSLKARFDPLRRVTRIVVRDDGVGMDPATLESALRHDGEMGGIGLRNIGERLENLFGERYRMDLRSRPDDGTTVDLRIPLR
ncbi:MAG: sensor histidine kinase [Egibacteraceae bacterium]